LILGSYRFILLARSGALAGSEQNVGPNFYGFPDIQIYCLYKNLHAGFPIMVTHAFKNRRPIYRIPFRKEIV